MGIGMLLFWPLVITVIVVLVQGIRAKTGNAESAAGQKSALESLAARYANGDIDKSEFEQKRSALLQV